MNHQDDKIAPYLQHRLYLTYEIIGCTLAFAAFIFAIINFTGIGSQTTHVASGVIYLYFLADFTISVLLCRGWEARKEYVKNHLWELVALMPADVLATDPDIKHLMQLLRSIAYLMRLMNRARNFFDTCGFKYAIALFLMLIALGTWGFSVHENRDMFDSAWWAIATVTTVGYGDVIPATSVGKLIGVGLMAIGVIFIGLITSTITAFITRGQMKQDEQKRALKKKRKHHGGIEHQEARHRILHSIKSDIDRVDELTDADIEDIAKVLKTLRKEGGKQ